MKTLTQQDFKYCQRKSLGFFLCLLALSAYGHIIKPLVTSAAATLGAILLAVMLSANRHFEHLSSLACQTASSWLGSPIPMAIVPANACGRSIFKSECPIESTRHIPAIVYIAKLLANKRLHHLSLVRAVNHCYVLLILEQALI